MQTFISGFRDKNIGKPEPWDGEDEAVFKTWQSSRLAGVGDNVRKKVIKHIGEMDEDDNLEAEEDAEHTMIDLKVNPDLSDEMQDTLCDQLTQYTNRARRSCPRSGRGSECGCRFASQGGAECGHPGAPGAWRIS